MVQERFDPNFNNNFILVPFQINTLVRAQKLVRMTFAAASGKAIPLSIEKNVKRKNILFTKKVNFFVL